MLLLQVTNSSTLPASAQPGHVAVSRQDSLPGLACHGLTKRQILKKDTHIINGALAETTKGIEKGGHGEMATRVLVLVAEAYTDSLKARLSRRLQVEPHYCTCLDEQLRHSLMLAACGVTGMS